MHKIHRNRALVNRPNLPRMLGGASAIVERGLVVVLPYPPRPPAPVFVARRAF